MASKEITLFGGPYDGLIMLVHTTADEEPDKLVLKERYAPPIEYVRCEDGVYRYCKLLGSHDMG